MLARSYASSTLYRRWGFWSFGALRAAEAPYAAGCAGSAGFRELAGLGRPMLGNAGYALQARRLALFRARAPNGSVVIPQGAPRCVPSPG